jgi:hypothetical protein
MKRSRRETWVFDLSSRDNRSLSCVFGLLSRENRPTFARQETKNARQETKNARQETKNTQQEIKNARQETKNARQETKNCRNRSRTCSIWDKKMDLFEAVRQESLILKPRLSQDRQGKQGRAKSETVFYFAGLPALNRHITLNSGEFVAKMKHVKLFV